MSFLIVYILAVIPIMVGVQKVRGQIKPRIKAWLIAKAQTRPNLSKAIQDPLLGMYVRMFTNSMFLSAFIFMQLMTFLGVFPANPPDWVELFAIGFATLAFGALFPVISDAREGKGIFKETENLERRH